MRYRNIFVAIATSVLLATLLIPACASNDGMLFSDGFSNPSTGWLQYGDDAVFLGYRNGEYTVEVKEEERLRWSWAPIALAQEAFTVRVDIDMESCKAGSYGLVYGEDDGNLVFVHLSSRGYYAVDQLVDGAWAPSLIPWTAIGAGFGCPGTATLQLTRTGSTGWVTIDGRTLDSFSCTSYEEGLIGLAAQSHDSTPVRVEFDDFVLSGPLIEHAQPGGAQELQLKLFPITGEYDDGLPVYHVGGPIVVAVIIENVSDKDVLIHHRFAVGPDDSPYKTAEIYIRNLEGLPVEGRFEHVTVFPPMASDFRTLPPGDSVHGLADLSFFYPALTSGVYSIRASYANYLDSPTGEVWKGRVHSFEWSFAVR